ncbi:MAG: flagellar biosynthesis anti-sigma factor FlgM [Planctomycetes bacterium]|nr:flagellar biosynthesis anti-sigma factor FlgM [Planctomycetota bacterium]MBU4398484.1 flagellar biosynthesis anti-sigma factor FlgM [Planctomycetota bacterium]MCG2683393.1 flagellar biosynthesis anti-sigma factor FlgM [Planctomycetales bacterium]
MHIYGPSQLHGPQPISAPHGAKPAQQIGRPEAPQIADEVDISEAARLVEQVQQMPETRGDRVEAVRQQIAEGAYETRDKLNVAVERLLDEIG